MQEKIQTEMQQLVEHGQELRQHTRFIGELNASQILLAQTQYYEFWTRALNLVGSACGNDSDHYLGLRQLGEAPAFANFGACLGIVEAAQHDFEAGLLFDLKSLIVAELAGDFIEQAETLLAAGCHVPAASLAGAVLEDTLRKMCQKRSMPLPDRTSINRLNVDLAKAGAYLGLTQKQITTHAEVRNHADHGHYDKFTHGDVEDMVKWLRRLVEQHLQ